MIDAWPKVRGERGNYPNPPFGSNGFAGARHRRIPTIRHPVYDADADKPFSTYLTSHTFRLPLTKYIVLILYRYYAMSSWEPPLEILKALAKRVNDAELFSATGQKRGPAPTEPDAERAAEQCGYADFLGILPATQLDILKIINLNRSVAFDDAAFATDLDGAGTNDQYLQRVYVWADFRQHNGDMPSRILAKALECSKGVGDDHRFPTAEDLVSAVRNAATSVVSAPTGASVAAVPTIDSRAPIFQGMVASASSRGLIATDLVQATEFGGFSAPSTPPDDLLNVFTYLTKTPPARTGVMSADDASKEAFNQNRNMARAIIIYWSERQCFKSSDNVGDGRQLQVALIRARDAIAERARSAWMSWARDESRETHAQMSVDSALRFMKNIYSGELDEVILNSLAKFHSSSVVATRKSASIDDLEPGACEKALTGVGVFLEVVLGPLAGKNSSGKALGLRMSQLLKNMNELAAGCRPLTADSRGEAFIVRQILAPAIRQSLFSPLEEVVDTNEFDPAADPPQSLRVCLEQANLSLKAGSAMSWYTQILTKLRDLNSSGGTDELRSFSFAMAKSAGGVVPPSSAEHASTPKKGKADSAANKNNKSSLSFEDCKDRHICYKWTLDQCTSSAAKCRFTHSMNDKAIGRKKKMLDNLASAAGRHRANDSDPALAAARQQNDLPRCSRNSKATATGSAAGRPAYTSP